MLSIIITAYKEEKTIQKAVQSFLNQKIPGDFEILVFSPDQETRNAVLAISKNNKRVKHFYDSGKGKPAALNGAFKKAKGDILILTDGDVYINQHAVVELLKKFKDEEVGAVTGRPVSLNSRNNKYGYWSHLLTDQGAHLTRLERAKKGEFIACSGYLLALRKGIVKKIPEEVLADDAFISQEVWKKGYKIAYAPTAKVYVKFPTNWSDWILQKTRSAGGYNQLKKYFKKSGMRSFSKEILQGTSKALSYPQNGKEWMWTIELFFARLYMWLKIFIYINIQKKSQRELWKRVESTK